MKANELRIGNWVNANKPIQVNEITNDGINLTKGMYSDSISINYDLDLIDPIALTPEIFEKCGGKNKIFGAGLFIKNDFYVRWVNHSYFLCYDNSDLSDSEIITTLSVEHLHQLQNLYFALTGSELEINL